MVAIFPNVCLWRRSYSQNWEVLTPKNCHSIEPPSYASTAYVIASYGPRFFSTEHFVKIWVTCENFLGKWFTVPPWQKIARTPNFIFLFSCGVCGGFLSLHFLFSRLIGLHISMCCDSVSFDFIKPATTVARFIQHSCLFIF